MWVYDMSNIDNKGFSERITPSIISRFACSVIFSPARIDSKTYYHYTYF